jgi:SAM-dependent methyltransferase
MQQQRASDYPNYSWEERYQEGKEALPWDSGEPAVELVEYFNGLQSPPKSVFEVGCGTGTNAIWMSKQGCEVTATDISPTAIDLAKAKAENSKKKIQFAVSDIVQTLPVPPNSVDFVFDRGVYHTMTPKNRKLFAERVALALSNGGFWLCLAGSSDQIRAEGEMGPPQLKAADLIDNIEEYFEIHELKRASFILPDGSVHLAWKALFRKRG